MPFGLFAIFIAFLLLGGLGHKIAWLNLHSLKQIVMAMMAAISHWLSLGLSTQLDHKYLFYFGVCPDSEKRRTHPITASKSPYTITLSQYSVYGFWPQWSCLLY